VLLVRSAGPHAATYLGGLLGGRYVKADQVARLARLVAAHGEGDFELACRRALHFAATEGALVVERILEKGLHRTPLPDAPVAVAGGEDFPRPLSEYEALLSGKEVA
jgi:hypothetical protein